MAVKAEAAGGDAVLIIGRKTSERNLSTPDVEFGGDSENIDNVSHMDDPWINHGTSI